MNINRYQTEFRKMIDQRNGYLVLSVGLIGLCIILSILVAFLIGRERIVLVPQSMNKNIWVSSSTASPEYLTRMSLFLSELALNVTGDNVDSQQELLLRYVDPSYYHSLKPELITEADRIKKDHISTSFYPVDIKVDDKLQEAIVIGDLKSYVGDTALPTKRISYRFVYRFNSFTPLITLFEEVKNA
jgi:conjugal transfer pilus assembly protein TraE